MKREVYMREREREREREGEKERERDIEEKRILWRNAKNTVIKMRWWLERKKERKKDKIYK